MFPVFFDTCALYGEVTCDMILSLAEAKLFKPYWSVGVQEELQRVLSPVIGQEKIQYRLSMMNRAFPDALIEDYADLTPKMLCDEGDRHVLAAAVRSPANTLVTFNLKDFPKESRIPYGIEVVHPDDFLLDVLDIRPGFVANVIYQMMQMYRRCPQTPEELCGFLHGSLPHFSETLLPLLEAIDESRI
ncbi:PIN domain-containing protein [Bifidobacterium lemurum]|uniref:PIN domain-containing protein n=1 Tax=Bifidobacterium lemurum TaxID=1603886 RepID=A0A261FRH6_9BIFI|nr:PIN domain-containing protein [Bifidobacterium lemurum]OZG61790.1 PIN domain-containing protein [Bifidobacterium lemurum]QOL34942.1 PIN domain-containing protein [Bifidobacterium lemurum]